MPQSYVKTFTIFGLEGHEITIEADSNKAIPTIEIIWLPDAAIKESKERLRATFRNAGVELPPRKIILNLAPSDIKKVWTQFDLPMAAAILFLVSGGIYHEKMLSSTLFFGELWLDGSIRRITGLLPAVIAAMKRWYTTFFIPIDNIYELEYIQWITIYPLSSFSELVEFFITGKKKEAFVSTKSLSDLATSATSFPVDFSSIKWHLVAKRALAIAAAWGHNVLMVWAPGSWKTLLSHALQSILPPLHFDEMVEVSQIYSIVGKLSKEQPLITQRPFRPVHHTASKVSIIGGWASLQPWEVSLAHKWILFFDELPEFPREVLEVLRQPIEDKQITISRAAWSVWYPAHFMFISAMNPCKCGYYKDPEKPCVCWLLDIKRYQSKISWPLLDRIDMILEIPRENVETLFEKSQWVSSASLREKVMGAREIQQKRYVWTGIFSNAWVTSKEIQKYIILDEQAENFLKQAAQKLHLSWRVIHRMLKLARTIADVEWVETVGVPHIAEAMQYRSKTMFVENV